MIGVAWHILDAMMLKVHSPNLTHEVPVTLMVEVTAIMNCCPLVPVSSDPQQQHFYSSWRLRSKRLVPEAIETGAESG